jgi:hypothetical protein
LTLDPEFQEAVDKRDIAMLTATELMKIEDPEFRRYYMRAAADNGVTTAVAAQWVSDYEKSRMAQYYADGGGAPILNIPPELKPTFLTCGGCNGPVEVGEARSYLFCPECQKALKG